MDGKRLVYGTHIEVHQVKEKSNKIKKNNIASFWHYKKQQHQQDTSDDCRLFRRVKNGKNYQKGQKISKEKSLFLVEPYGTVINIIRKNKIGFYA